MKWILFLLVVNIGDPTDIPGEIHLKFKSEEECEKIATTMAYKVKFDWFKVTAVCKQES
jgi:hypothetical protein